MQSRREQHSGVGERNGVAEHEGARHIGVIGRFNHLAAQQCGELSELHLDAVSDAKGIGHIGLLDLEVVCQITAPVRLNQAGGLTVVQYGMEADPALGFLGHFELQQVHGEVVMVLVKDAHIVATRVRAVEIVVVRPVDQAAKLKTVQTQQTAFQRFDPVGQVHNTVLSLAILCRAFLEATHLAFQFVNSLLHLLQHLLHLRSGRRDRLFLARGPHIPPNSQRDHESRNTDKSFHTLPP